MRHGPRCQSPAVIKHGHIHNGTPKFAAKQGGRQFVEHPAKQPIAAETTALIDNRRFERLPLAGIARVTGVSIRWLQYYGNQTYHAQPRQVNVPAQKKGG